MTVYVVCFQYIMDFMVVGSLRQVYGTSLTSNNANDKTLFTQYMPYTDQFRSDAVSYFRVPFTPITYTSDDYDADVVAACSDIRVDPSPSEQCMFDHKTIDAATGQSTLQSIIQFEELTTILCEYSKPI